MPEDTNYILISKTFEGKTRTYVTATPTGLASFNNYLHTLRLLLKPLTNNQTSSLN
ncbi:transcriptional regulator [Bifidobacterium commune]